ncbi:hypothetical protein CDL15_Pgr025096 [Punica granatum]|uniref:Homeobox domain-containing protein n=1 Tax=Punica granatum TaxID=22663 RepID=A0A218W8T8_PUNGR|nr:hypothetical protein CDL15_Pgr025096 [Punica granatum]
MEMHPPRPESHVAQSSRRDKLRVAAGHHLDEFPGHLGQRMVYSGLMLPSNAVDSPSHSNAAQLIHRDGTLHQLTAGVSPSNQLVVSEDASFRLYGGDPHHIDGLRRPSLHYSIDWAAYHSSGSTNEDNQNPMYVREVLSADLKASNTLSAPVHYLAKNDTLNRYRDPSIEISSQDSQHGNVDGFPSKCYQETLLEVVSSAAVASGLNAGNELALLPTYGRELNALNCSNVVAWNNNPAEISCHRGISSDTNAQGLSLTLSSNPSSSMLMIRNDQDPEAFSSGYSNAVTRPSVIGKKSGKALHEITGVSTCSVQWSTGPLGPFTGYATILKCSKFLKPAQDLLEELCRVTWPKPVEMRIMLERISEESCMSSSSGGGSSSSTNFPSEDQQKRATLLFMQDEVCRRYKQYHQQMQMVVSSFETVAGLSAATPYISLALKTVARNFRCLKSAIFDQLRTLKKSSGDDYLSPNTSAKGDLNSSKMTNSSQNFTRSRYFGANMSFLDAPHHVWRPQRGLPERAVAILRAWLFEHFLHPYPTDTDKHMLATQTGLSRNQVSNWFINARVRLWKPMVEEIHALETKRLGEANPNSAPNREASCVEVSSQREAMDHQPSSSGRVDHHMASAAVEERIQCSGDGLNAEQWNQEFRSRLEGQLPVSSEGPLIGFMRYPQGGMEFGGIGAVSLSLGLRHNAQRQDDELRQQFGGAMMRDFVD